MTPYNNENISHRIRRGLVKQPRVTLNTTVITTITMLHRADGDFSLMRRKWLYTDQINCLPKKKK